MLVWYEIHEEMIEAIQKEKQLKKIEKRVENTTN